MLSMLKGKRAPPPKAAPAPAPAPAPASAPAAAAPASAAPLQAAAVAATAAKPTAAAAPSSASSSSSSSSFSAPASGPAAASARALGPAASSARAAGAGAGHAGAGHPGAGNVGMSGHSGASSHAGAGAGHAGTSHSGASSAGAGHAGAGAAPTPSGRTAEAEDGFGSGGTGTGFSPSLATAPPSAGGVPRADLSLPLNHGTGRKERRRSSIGSAVRSPNAFSSAATQREMMLSAIIELPPLRDVPSARREQLFRQKLAVCSVMGLDWDSPSGDARVKEIKRQTLIELVDYTSLPAGQKVLTEATYADVISMVSANISRALPPSTVGSGEEDTGGVAGTGEGGEDDELFLEPSWPHLQLVYEFLLRFIISNEVKIKAAKKQVDAAFCAKLIDLFDSEDPRERDYLKTILHRIYGKFLSHRSFIRRAISNVFYRFVYETEQHNGVGELLEILGSIINGFALPLKEEHVSFLEKALIPLHRPRCITTYVQQLSFCMVQYIDKDPATVCNIVRGLIRTWPWSSSQKQIVLLSELEELLELAGADAAQPVLKDLFSLLSRCAGSSHFQVAERALALWSNEQLATAPNGVLSRAYAATAVPLLFESLHRQASGHWNPNVDMLARNVVALYEDADPALFARVAAGAAAERERRVQGKERGVQAWAALEREVCAARAARGAGAGAAAAAAVAVSGGAGSGAGAGGSAEAQPAPSVAGDCESKRDDGDEV